VYLFVSKWNARWSVLTAKLLDIILLFIYSTGGLLLVYMSMFSLHTACHDNFNIAWIHPLYLVALICYIIKPIWANYLGRVFMIASIGLILVSFWIPQSFSISVYLLMGLSILLNYRLIKRGRDAKYY
jgi:hypothetical protein